MRAFDDAYTAPVNGFAGAADYYERAGAIHVMRRIAVPALIISAKDDPFIPAEPFSDPRVAGNRHITVDLTEFGGHCAFLTKPCTEHDGYWAEWRIVEFARQTIGERGDRKEAEAVDGNPWATRLTAASAPSRTPGPSLPPRA